MGDLSGRIAVVTGASAGIGLAVVESLVEGGARVVASARRAERLGELCARLGEERVVAVAGDAADPGAIERMLDGAADRFGREADLVIANAGRGLRGSPLTSDASEWEAMFRINVLGATRLLRAAAERMLASGPDPKEGPAWLERARDLIAISSNVGKHISPFSSMYGSSKFALTSIAEAMRRELAGKGIRVTAVHPGIVRSEFQEVAGYDPVSFGEFMDSIGPVLTPADVARTVRFIASQPANVSINDVMIRPTRQEYP